jgi:hypothetical protein
MCIKNHIYTALNRYCLTQLEVELDVGLKIRECTKLQYTRSADRQEGPQGSAVLRAREGEVALRFLQDLGRISQAHLERCRERGIPSLDT